MKGQQQDPPDPSAWLITHRGEPAHSAATVRPSPDTRVTGVGGLGPAACWDGVHSHYNFHERNRPFLNHGRRAVTNFQDKNAHWVSAL